MKPQRTCDRCYKIKSRCVYVGGSLVCERCTRLNHSCEAQRDVLQPGRPRAASTSRKSPTTRNQLQRVLSTASSQQQLLRNAQLSQWTRGFEDQEIFLIDFMLQPSQIASLLFGQTFQSSMRSNIASQLFTATDQLKDGFLAFAKALLDHQNSALGRPVQVSPDVKSSLALQKLSTLDHTSIENARIALALALMLITYNDLSVGTTTLPVTRSALLHVESRRDRLIGMSDEDTDPNLICILFVEMYECIVFGKIPIFRWEPPAENTIIDRYYGISHELLPHLYDICLLYASLKQRVVRHDSNEADVDLISTLVDEWSPDAELDRRTWSHVEQSERHHFLLQAQAFKSSAQLLLLQLQQTPSAKTMAQLKAKQLEAQIFSTMQHGIDRPKYVLFPYFIACMELYSNHKEMHDEILNNMNEISNNLAPRACQSMLACLQHIWRNRRRRPDLAWVQCVDDGQLFGMGP